MVNTPPSLPSTENHIPPTLPSDLQLLILLLSYAVHLSLLVFYLLFSPTYFALFSRDVSPEKLNELCFFSFLNSTFSIQFCDSGTWLSLESDIHFLCLLTINPSILFFCFFIFIPPSIFNCLPILISPHASCLCVFQDNAFDTTVPC